MTRSPVNAAKVTALKWFKKYIRVRDALATTGTKTEALCITCKRRLPIEKLDCGHFVPGRKMPLLLMEENAATQCPGCNRFRSGAWPEFERAMRLRHGAMMVEHLKWLYDRDDETTEAEFRELSDKYRMEYRALVGKNDRKNKAR